MIDTADKRRSATGLLWWSLSPLPDGSMVEADRQQVCWVYDGILAGMMTFSGNRRGTVTAVQVHRAAVTES